jgi:hypothetical protein
MKLPLLKLLRHDVRLQIFECLLCDLDQWTDYIRNSPLHYLYQHRFQAKFIGHLQDSIANYYVGIPMLVSTLINSISLS